MEENTATQSVERKRSPLWDSALQNYREELAGDDDFQVILETGTSEELLNDPKVLQPVGPQGRKTLKYMSQVKPMIKLVNDFLAVVAVSFGTDAALTALIWGSLRMILTLASSAESILQEILDMLEELSLPLPSFRVYEQAMPMNNDLETFLVDVYTEVVCFYARTIHFFRSHRNVLLLRNSWSKLRDDFNMTVQRIRQLSETFEREVQLTRIRYQKFQEFLSLVASSQAQTSTAESRNRHYLPSTEDPRFWGREDVLSRVDRALHSGAEDKLPRSFAIYGMAGVGKTQVALRYANQSRCKYDGVFWISADNSLTIVRSLREIGTSIGLIQPEAETNDNEIMLKVKNWLSATESRWLLIFDNANDLNILKPVWPGNVPGSVLFTSRNSDAAFAMASEGCHIKPFDMANGSSALLAFTGLDQTSEFNIAKAKEIASVVGGLPLALRQIAEYIVQHLVPHSEPLQHFLELYERDPLSIDSNKAMNINYHYTLATVWETSLSSLTGSPKVLHMILAFLDPDAIQEPLLTDGARLNSDQDLHFLEDEMELLDAEAVLLQEGLIDKSIETGIISIHRLIQRAIIRRMSLNEKERFFSLVVGMLASSFPDTFSADVGHQATSWTRCGEALPHIENLIKQSEQHHIFVEDNQPFAELLLRCSWYLYERERYKKALSYVVTALEKFSDCTSLAYASAIDLQGLIELDICHPGRALESFERAFDLRRTILAEDDPFLAANLVNLGLAYTELGELEKAHDFLQRSIDIRLACNSDRIGNSYSNMSSLLVRMGKADEAEEILRRCPSLKDFTNETFLKTGNPRFSGDMVLIARIRLQQGRYSDALNYASKALTFRRDYLDERLKVCDSLYQVANILSEGGNTALAIQLLCECVEISQSLPECEGQRHLARAHHKLAGIFITLDKEKESAEHRDRAHSLARDISDRDACSVDDFEALVPWMLW